MKKLESSLINMVLVLVGVAVVMGCILAYVNHLTSGPIQQQKEKALAEGIKTVMGAENLKQTKTDTIKTSENGKEQTYIIYHVEDAKGQTLGAAVESTTMGFGGDLKVLVGFNPDGTILGYTLLEHAETPGLGAKADKWFQKDGKGNIIGKNPKETLKVKKDGGQIDAITASTITSRAFLNAVNQAYNAYMSNTKEEVKAEDVKQPEATTGATKQKKEEQSHE